MASKISFGGFGKKKDKEKDASSSSSSAAASAARVEELENEKRELEDQLQQKTEMLTAVKANMQEMHKKTQALEEELSALKESSKSRLSASPNGNSGVSGELDLLSGLDGSAGSVIMPEKSERVRNLEQQVASLNDQLDNVKEIIKESEAKEKANQTELAQQKSLLDERDKEIIRLKSEWKKTEDGLRKEISALKSSSAALSEENKKQIEEAKKFKEEIAKLKEELKTSNNSSVKSETNENKKEEGKGGLDLLAVDLLSSTSATPVSVAASSAAASASDSRVAELESELAGLKAMNAKIIATLQKKDEAIRDAREETEKTSKKLADLDKLEKQLKEKEKEIASISKEKDKEIDKLTKEIKQKESDLKKAKSSGGDDQGKSKVLTEALTKSNERISALQKELDDLRVELNGKESAISQIESAVEAKEELIKALQSREELQERKIAEFCDKMERNAAEFKKNLDLLEKKYSSDVEALQNRDKNEEKFWKEKVKGLETRIAELAEQVKVKEREAVESEGKYEMLLEKERELNARIESLQAELLAANRRVEDSLAESRIESKKRNQIVNELRSALHKETMKAKSHEMKCLELEDELRTAKLRAQRLAVEGGSNGTIDSPSSSSSSASSSSSSSSSSSNSAGNSSSNSSSSSSNVSNSIGGGSTGGLGGSSNAGPLSSPRRGQQPVNAADEEVSAALATKLAQVQDDNFTLKRRIGGLEEHIKFLTEDVNQKKQMIRDFVRRIETGALTTTEQALDKTSESRMYSQLKSDEKQALFDKMEIVLQETTMANLAMKEQLRVMGEEVRRATEQKQAGDEKETGQTAAAAALTAEEIESLKSQLEELKEEKELAETGAADAAKLVKSMHSQLEEKEILIKHLKEMMAEQAQSQQIDGNLREKLSKLEIEKLSLSTQVSQLQSQVSQLNDQVTQLNSHIETLNKQIASLQAEKVNLQLKLDELHKEKAQVEEQLRQAENERQQAVKRAEAAAVTLSQMETDAASRQADTQREAEERLAAAKTAAAEDLARLRSELEAKAAADRAAAVTAALATASANDKATGIDDASSVSNASDATQTD